MRRRSPYLASFIMTFTTSAKPIVAGHFPGARSENAAWIQAALGGVLEHWFEWRRTLFPQDVVEDEASPALSRETLAEQLDLLCRKLTAETPTCTPRYVAHMKSDVSTPALLGWIAAMLHNPNNTSRDASRVGSVLEAEALDMLAIMLGYDPVLSQGHFTSGGTVANMEAVWRARYRMDHWLSLALWLAENRGRRLDVFADAHMGWARYRLLRSTHEPAEDALRDCSAVVGDPVEVHRRLDRASNGGWRGPILLAPATAHYSWRKAASVFGYGENALWSVPLGADGRMDLDAFDSLITQARDQGRPVLLTVGVAGATETGQIDSLHVWRERLDQLVAEDGLHVWSHVDAAYGGFFRAASGIFDTRTAAALDAVGAADSVTIDPHKLGYTPYACGAFLTRDVESYAVSSFDAPYLARPELGDAKWASTLEGSRSGAGAAAVWLTGRTLGFGPAGLGEILAETIRVRRRFQAALVEMEPEVRFLDPADTNIACFSIAVAGEPLSCANRRTEALFAALSQSTGFAVSKTELGAASAAVIRSHVGRWRGLEDASNMTVIRCVFTNPYWSDAMTQTKLFAEFAALVKDSIQRTAAPQARRVSTGPFAA